MKKAEKVPEEKNKGSFKSRRLDCISTFVTENEAMDYSRNGKEKKEYYTVAVRHNHFAKYFPEHRINTDLVEFLCNEKQVATKTTIYIGEEPYATGLALEKFDYGYVNKTSALENCETSSLGRALAAFGLHGSEFSSADELVNALNNQNKNWSAEINRMTTQTKLNELFNQFETYKEKIDKEFTTKNNIIKKQGGHNATKWE